jgi:hypothetical protein
MDREARQLKLPVVTGTLDLYIKEINRFPLLTPEEEFKLAVRLKKYNDMSAAETLIVSNLRFVVKIAHEYHNYGFNLMPSGGFAPTFKIISLSPGVLLKSGLHRRRENCFSN